jgi:hypothetical protein
LPDDAHALAAEMNEEPSVPVDWRDGGVGEPTPRVLCGTPTILRSPRGVACHKLRAEAWTAQHGATVRGQR